MSRGPANPFEPLEPPRGGLAALRSRIEVDSSRRLRRRRRWTLAGATSVPLALLLVALALTLQPQAPLPEGLRWARIAAGLDEAPAEPVTVTGDHEHRVVAQRVPTSSENVVFYRVGSLAVAPEVEVPDARERPAVNPE